MPLPEWQCEVDRRAFSPKFGVVWVMTTCTVFNDPSGIPTCEPFAMSAGCPVALLIEMALSTNLIRVIESYSVAFKVMQCAGITVTGIAGMVTWVDSLNIPMGFFLCIADMNRCQV